MACLRYVRVCVFSRLRLSDGRSGRRGGRSLCRGRHYAEVARRVHGAHADALESRLILRQRRADRVEGCRLRLATLPASAKNVSHFHCHFSNLKQQNVSHSQRGADKLFAGDFGKIRMASLLLAGLTLGLLPQARTDALFGRRVALAAPLGIAALSLAPRSAFAASISPCKSGANNVRLCVNARQAFTRGVRVKVNPTIKLNPNALFHARVEHAPTHHHGAMRALSTHPRTTTGPHMHRHRFVPVLSSFLFSASRPPAAAASASCRRGPSRPVRWSCLILVR